MKGKEIFSREQTEQCEQKSEEMPFTEQEKEIIQILLLMIWLY